MLASLDVYLVTLCSNPMFLSYVSQSPPCQHSRLLCSVFSSLPDRVVNAALIKTSHVSVIAACLEEVFQYLQQQHFSLPQVPLRVSVRITGAFPHSHTKLRARV